MIPFMGSSRFFNGVKVGGHPMENVKCDLWRIGWNCT